MITETPPSPETSQAIAALTDSPMATTENMEDVTVTITIKKDKNKISASPTVTVNNSAQESAKSADKNTGKESE